MKKLILLLLAFTSIFSTKAQWQRTNGPNGSFIYCLASSGTTILAGTYNDGVFITNNNGNSWSAANNGLTNLFVPTLAVSGSNVFAGTYGDGVFISANNGSSWTAINNGLTTYGYRVWSIVINGINIFAGTEGGVFLSVNNGSSWTQMNNGLGNTFVTSVAVSGINVFAGTGGGLYMSVDNGNNWTYITDTILPNTGHWRLATHGTNIYAGTEGAGIYLSTNNGNNWIQVNTGLADSHIWSIVFSGTNIFAGTGRGVSLSKNNGSSWTTVNDGLTDTRVGPLTISGTEIFAGTDTAGVWKRQLSEMVGIEDFNQNNDFSLYPNPSGNEIRIQNLSMGDIYNVSVKIYDVPGSCVYDSKRKPGKFKQEAIDISALLPGIYFLQIKTEKTGTVVKKFIKE